MIQEILVEWHKGGDGEQGLRNLRFGDIITDIVANGNNLKIESNKSYSLVINGKKYKVKKGSQTFNLK